MINTKAYCQEVTASVRRVFERRGFSFAEHVITDKTDAATIRAVVLLEGRQMGLFSLRYKKHVRRRRQEDGSLRTTHHPVRHSLYLEVSWFPESGDNPEDVAHKSSSFLRGTPGQPGLPLLNNQGRLCGGRPKIRKWAAYAAKALAVYHATKQAEYVHDV
jgi:hypothetical protein